MNKRQKSLEDIKEGSILIEEIVQEGDLIWIDHLDSIFYVLLIEGDKCITYDICGDRGREVKFRLAEIDGIYLKSNAV